MDEIPRDFSERVAATWKCCREDVSCDCILPEFSGRTWTFRKMTGIGLNIYLNSVNGRCEFTLVGFGENYALSELLKRPDCKQLRIKFISVHTTYTKVDRMKPATDETEKLLNFVSFLANEPRISFYSKLDSRKGSRLLNWLEEQRFSSIKFWTYHSVYNQILRKQYSGRHPDKIELENATTHEHRQFFSEKLTNLIDRRRGDCCR